MSTENTSNAAMPPGRDGIAPTDPRRIAMIAHLSEQELQHESLVVRQMCRDFREKALRAAYARAIAAKGEE